MEVKAAWVHPVASAGKLQVVEAPANWKTERVVKLSALTVGERKLFEASNEPRQRILAATGGIEPSLPWDVGFDIGVFFEEWNEAWPGGTAGTFGLIVIPIIVPGNFDMARGTAHEPARHVERKRVLHGGARDAGRVEVVEQRHVGMGRAQFRDAFVKNVEEMFEARDMRRRVRECPQEKQAFMETDEMMRILEIEPRELA